MEDDGDDKDDSKRRIRNRSEKKRRDQFNLLVNELSTMVSASSRKMDKSTVLKSTISFLKNHNEITVKSRAHDIQGDWKPGFLSNEEFTYLVLEALEGFVMVFSATGHIHYVSESITSLLGQNVTDVVNKSIFDLAFEEDRQNLYNLLQGPKTAVDSVLRVGQGNEIRFQCHLRRGMLDFRDESTYELIEFNGHFRSNTEPLDDEEMYQLEPDSRVLFVCTGRLYTPQLIRDVSLAAASEFTSRHSLEWKFLFLDHRAPPIIGYLPFEVLGTSGYDYYHFDDLEKVVSCHEELMEKGELTSCYYRFLTKGQQWIWLQTRFYITYHQWNSKPEFVVCTHRVVNYADVAKSEKQESSEVVIGDEEQAGSTVKEVPSEESIRVVSPAYMSEATEPYGSSYQPMSQDASVKFTLASSTASAMNTTADSVPTSLGPWPRSCSARYATGSVSASDRYVPSDTMSVRYVPSDTMSVRYVPSDTMSVRYVPSDTMSVRYAPYNTMSVRYVPSNSMSVRYQTAETASARYVAESEAGSLSGESRSSRRSSTLEIKTKRSLVPEWAIGAEYLEPAPYVNPIGAMGTVSALAPLGAMGAMGAIGAVGPMGTMAAPAVHAVQGVIPLSIQSLPVIVTPDQAHVQWPWQEQLQQKHEKLQQMIMRQQEELRQVKEQLLLARLGMLQPLPNMPPAYLNEQNQNAPSLPAEVVYEEQPGQQTISRYPPQPPPGHPHLPPGHPHLPPGHPHLPQ